MKITTNVVLLRGWYNRLTVCLYGEFTEIIIDNNQAPPPPPPQNIMFGIQQLPNQMSAMPKVVLKTMDIERERREHGAALSEKVKQGFGEEKGLTGETDCRERSRLDQEGKERGKGMTGDRRDKTEALYGKHKSGSGREKDSDRVKRSMSGKMSEVKSMGETTEAKKSTADGKGRVQVWLVFTEVQFLAL